MSVSGNCAFAIQSGMTSLKTISEFKTHMTNEETQTHGHLCYLLGLIPKSTTVSGTLHMIIYNMILVHPVTCKYTVLYNDTAAKFSSQKVDVTV